MEDECTHTIAGQSLNKTSWPDKALKVKCRVAFQLGWVKFIMKVSLCCFVEKFVCRKEKASQFAVANFTPPGQGGPQVSYRKWTSKCAAMGKVSTQPPVEHYNGVGFYMEKCNCFLFARYIYKHTAVQHCSLIHCLISVLHEVF